MPTAEKLGLKPGEVARLGKRAYRTRDIHSEIMIEGELKKITAREVTPLEDITGKGPKVRILGIEEEGTLVEFLENEYDIVRGSHGLGYRQMINPNYNHFGRIR